MSALAEALLAFQNDPPHVSLDATNPHYGSKFASLPGVVAAVRPALNRHGLVVTQLPSFTTDGAAALETRLIHAESGEEIASTMPLATEKPGPQGQASAITYARRIALLAILGLVGDEDDDANAAQTTDQAAASDPHGLQRSHGGNGGGAASDKQKNFIRVLAKKAGLDAGDLDGLTKDEASLKIKELQTAEQATKDAAAVGGGASDMDDIPFAASEF